MSNLLPTTSVAALLNRQGYGEVCTAAQLRDLLTRHGITAQKQFPLWHYLAKLCEQAATLPPPAAAPEINTRIYSDKRDKQNAKNRQESAQSRSIGRIPPVRNPERRAACAHDLARFLSEYFPHTFKWDFSPDHLDLIRQIEQTVFEGGQYVYAVYRGFGKTSIARGAIVWALVYGHAPVVPLVCSTDDNAKRGLQFVRLALWRNDELGADFPEACHPIRCLEGSNRRADGQVYEREDGSTEHTHVSFGKSEIQLATIEGYAGSGSVVTTLSLEGEVRGLNFTTPDGRALRPRFVIIDDPQTNQSAKSPQQVEKRLDIIMRDILMSSGHEEELACIMPATIIEENDLVAQLIDHSLHPEWIARKVRMLHSMPEDMEKWEEYGRIRRNYRESDRADRARAIRESGEYYLANRKEMLKGAQAAWGECYRRDARYCEYDAVQHAMNYYVDQGERVFMSECQNEPVNMQAAEERLTPEQLMGKVEPRLKRGVVPAWADELPGAVDIHDDMLFYEIVALRREDFRGHVVEYGTWPKQNRDMFTQGRGKGRVTLQMKYKGMGKEGAIRAGLQELTQHLAERVFSCEDGTQRQITRLGYDSNYMTQLVYEFCAGDPRLRVPLAGTYDNYTSQKGFFETSESKASRTIKRMNGTGYKSRPVERYTGLRLITYEANYAKTFLRERLLSPLAEPGSFSLHAGDRADHALLIEHWLCEQPSYVTGAKGREGWIWKPTRKGADNHWFDTTVYACVLGSLLECRKGGERPRTGRVRVKRVSAAERAQRLKGAGR